MMTADRPLSHLIDRLPNVRGRLRADEPMARFTWFRVGGPAEVLFEPADMDDLCSFLAARPKDVDVTVIGGTSNILIRDGGIPGIVIRLGKVFAGIDVDRTRITAGAAAADVNVARRARDVGLGGLEFMVGIPGTIGGALRMNAGAYGTEIRDVFESATAVDLDGTVHKLSVADMGFGYRYSDVPADYIFTEAVLHGTDAEPADIARRMAEISANREASQPVRERTGGSTFANPEGQKSWQLIDAAECRGLRIGGAMVSDAHCNFLINVENASARDLESLGEEVRRRVKETQGVDLHWEIRRLGVPAASDFTEVTS